MSLKWKGGRSGQVGMRPWICQTRALTIAQAMTRSGKL